MESDICGFLGGIWLLSLSTVLSKFVHVVAGITASSYFNGRMIFHRTVFCLFIRWWTFSSFHFGVIMNNAAVNLSF